MKFVQTTLIALGILLVSASGRHTLPYIFNAEGEYVSATHWFLFFSGFALVFVGFADFLTQGRSGEGRRRAHVKRQHR